LVYYKIFEQWMAQKAPELGMLTVFKHALREEWRLFFASE